MSTELTIQLVKRLFEAFLGGQGRLLRVENVPGHYTRVMARVEGEDLEVHIALSDTMPRVLRVIYCPQQPGASAVIFTTEADAKYQVKMLGVNDETPGHTIKKRVHEHFLTVTERQSHSLAS